MARAVVRNLGQPAKNLIINGNMDFWQRGVGPFTTNAAYTADRWSTAWSGYNPTTTQSTDVPTATQSGYQSRFSFLLTNGTGASPTGSQNIQVTYKLEGNDYQNLHGGKRGRLQFWVKSSITGTYSLTFMNVSANRTYNTTYSISAANTWTKISVDLAFDTTGTWNFNENLGMFVLFNLAAGSSLTTSNLNVWQATSSQGAVGMTQWGATTGATFRLSQVALYQTDTGTGTSLPFQRAGNTIEDELAMCQRYYFAKTSTGGTAIKFNGGNISGPREFFPVTMRISPTITVADGSGNAGKIFAANASSTTAGSSNQTPPSGVTSFPTSWHYSSGGFTYPNAGEVTNGCLGLFGYDYTADAEL